MNMIEFDVPIRSLAVNLNGNIIFEQWMPISELAVPNIIPNTYFISTFGRIYSFSNNQLIATYSKRPGWYLQVNVKLNTGITTRVDLHRALMITFCPVYNYKELEVNHKDGIKTNCFIWNLEWVTHSENILHAYNNNLIDRSGENNSTATITNEQAEKICRLLLEQKYTHYEIACIIKCKPGVVDAISAGNSWMPLYNKYNLQSIKNNRKRISDEDVHKVCKYFENNISKYNRFDLIIGALELLNLENNENNKSLVRRYLDKTARKNITSKYNY